MMKRVRRRPLHNTRLGPRKGVIYLPRAFIGTNVKVMTKGQYKFLLVTVKRLKGKLANIKRITYHEYTGTRLRH